MTHNGRVNQQVKQWMEQQFLAWQMREGGRKTVTEFARYLGVTRNSLNNWILRGQEPSGDNLETIARKMGPEIYDVLGLTRPDPELQRINSVWDDLSPRERLRLAESAEEYAGRRRRPADSRASAHGKETPA